MTQDNWEREFRDRFGIKVTPNNEEDSTKAFLLERFWQENTLGDMVAFIKELITKSQSELKEKIEGMKKEIIVKGVTDADEYYNSALSDILKLLEETK